jgi:hypothetical protein
MTNAFGWPWLQHLWLDDCTLISIYTDLSTYTLDIYPPTMATRSSKRKAEAEPDAEAEELVALPSESEEEEE